jgi:carbon starvation protein
MRRIVFNNYLDAGVCALFIILVLAMAFFTIKTCLRALRARDPSVHEKPVSVMRGAA